MAAIYVWEDARFEQLYPLTYLRPAYLLRAGLGTLLEHIRRAVPSAPAGVMARSLLAPLVAMETDLPINPKIVTKAGVLLINGRWFATGPLTMPEGTAGVVGDDWVWLHLTAEQAKQIDWTGAEHADFCTLIRDHLTQVPVTATVLAYPWQLLDVQVPAIQQEFARLGPAVPAPGPFHILNPAQVHIAADVQIAPGVVLDATGGPIILAAGAQVKANAVITGPVAIGTNSIVRTLADIREGTVLGPECRVGGEVIGSVFQAYANKQHHGFVGQTYVGAWANLGAGTTTSNLKNTYGNVRVPLGGVNVDTGRTFMGSLIGEHAKVGIGTYLSTGSVVGVASHLALSRPEKFTPSFAFTTVRGVKPLDMTKAIALTRLVMSRRHVVMPEAMADILTWTQIIAFTNEQTHKGHAEK